MTPTETVTIDQKITVLSMAIELKNYENELRSITDVYAELIKLIKGE